MTRGSESPFQLSMEQGVEVSAHKQPQEKKLVSHIEIQKTATSSDFVF